jgi:hypothetical protein
VTLAPRIVELLEAWDEKAARSLPGSDLALSVRYRLCSERLGANLERETLGACADELMRAWERRIGEGKPFDIFHGEAELAMAIARMRVSHAWAINDFDTGRAGVRRVRELVTARFAPAQSGELLAALTRMEEGLAASARTSRRGG